jgi:hypothetical protein
MHTCIHMWESGQSSRYRDWLRDERPRVQSSSPGKIEIVLSSISSKPNMGPTQPPIQWVPVALSPGVKRLGRVAGHSPPSSVEVKIMWIYTSCPSYVFMAKRLIS